jgi:hypothetical protein
VLTSLIAGSAILDWSQTRKATDWIRVFSLICPYCKSDDVRRSHRRAEDGVRRVLFCKAYRCLACQNRFFRPSTWRLFGAAATAALALTIVLTIPWPT